MLPQLGFAYIIICCSFFTRSTSGHCITHYPTYLPMYWFATTAPIDILFSACFCRVAFTQYSTFGSMAWKKLAHDGVQTMLLATLCKIVCCICTTLLMGDTMGGTFFVMDW
ncbi:hypothetical protein BDF22DRAFT_681781 [Syncephalis plumigaleata]|nr:hypothetical protein BDF22DRAFT_681781 [Syncephalis plumigaleata]